MKGEKNMSKQEYYNVMSLTKLIEKWAIDRGLDTADPNKQMLKLMEEVGELAQGIVKNNQHQIYDSIGDVYVALVILTWQMGWQIEYCIHAAWNEIKDRKGKLINGTFIKEEDLIKENHHDQ